MMYMHYCKRCHRVYMLNGHKQTCPKCRENIAELKITYLDYATMDLDAREQFCNCCADEEQLRKLSTTYRMYKYSKWYKELQTQFPATTIITTYSMSDSTPMENAVSVVWPPFDTIRLRALPKIYKFSATLFFTEKQKILLKNTEIVDFYGFS